MEYRNLGQSGLKVSPLCLGTMLFGGLTSDKEAARIVDSLRETGINFIDTADSYMNGESERVVGPLIKRDREEWVLATKAGNKLGPGIHEGSLSRKWLMYAIDCSLERLDTDYVDIYYLHHDDKSTPLDETVVAMGDIVAEGKARYWGFSNYRGWQIAEMVRLCDELGVVRPIIAQPYYNAFKRTPEMEYLPACAHYGIGVAPYSPLARGVLTGKYQPGKAPPKESRAGRKDAIIMATEYDEESLIKAQTIKAHAEKRGMTAGEFAILWVLNNELVTSVIAGARTFEQWQGYLSALDHEFTTDDEALVDSLVAPGFQSPAGYVPASHPFRGRRPRPGAACT
ncbi:MAG: aldo/keto reductase, partial [Rhodospirillales bacterium]|nr:aldo/keto reductase [Rhodospirillales bacterium]